MTKLQQINEHREKLGFAPLRALPDLADHCDTCGEQFDQKCLDYAKCLGCLAPVCSVSQEQLEAWAKQA